VSASRRLDINASVDSTDWGDGYCNEGYTGPLCSSCVRNGDDTYYLGTGSESGVLECLRCRSSLDYKTLLSIVTTPVVLIFLVLLFLAMAFALAYFSSGLFLNLNTSRYQIILNELEKESDVRTENIDGSTTFTKLNSQTHESLHTLQQQTKKISTSVANATKVVSTKTEGEVSKLTTTTTIVERGTFFMSLVRNGMKMQVQLKCLVAFLQIAGNISFNYSITWPANFERLMSALEVVNFDLAPYLGINCFATRFNYIDKMVAMTLLPLAVAVNLLMAYLFVTCAGRRKARVTGLLVEGTYKLPAELNSLFGQKEMATLREVFREFDDDESGEITIRKVGKVMKESFPNLTDLDIEERARSVIAAADTSGNGSITFTEYIILMDKARNGNQRQSLFSDLVDRIEAIVTKVAGQTLFYIFLALAFLSLVAVSTVLFNYFKCRSFPEAAGGEKRYLYKDYSVDCDSSRYKTLVWYAIAMVLIYPVGIPLLYVSLLFNHRKALASRETMFREASHGYPTTGHLLFLTSAYTYELYYFEVVECFRRLSLASVIGIVAADSAASPIIGVCISLAFNHVFTSLEPFKVQENNDFSIVLSNSLTLFFLAALMIKTDSMGDDKADQRIFGWLLIIVLCMGPAATSYHLMKRTATSVYAYLLTLLRKGGKVDDVREDESQSCANEAEQGGTPDGVAGVADKEPKCSSDDEYSCLEQASRSPSIDRDISPMESDSSRTNRTPTGTQDSKVHLTKGSNKSDSSPMQVRKPPGRLPKETSRTSSMRDLARSRDTNLSSSSVFKGRNSRYTRDTVDFAEDVMMSLNCKQFVTTPEKAEEEASQEVKMAMRANSQECGFAREQRTTQDVADDPEERPTVIKLYGQKRFQ